MAYLHFIVAVFFVAVTAGYADNIDDELRIVPRSEWGASNPKHPPTKLEPLPPSYVVISHTASPVCLTRQSCLNHLRNIQTKHAGQMGFNDIAYNFLVGGDGVVYEGRGWDVEGSHTSGWNGKSLGIAVVGEFSFKAPNQAQIDAVRRLLEFAVRHNKLAVAYKLLGHNQLAIAGNTANKLYNVIKTWEHWAENP